MRAGRIVLWALLLAPGLVPLIAPYPPFQDWPAHAGLIGFLARASDPASRIAEHFDYIGAIKLNCLIYLLGAGLAKILSPFAAANVVLGLSLAALGPAALFFCRALRADERASLLAVPLALGRHTYCGFIPNAAALPLLLMVFALVLMLLRRGPRWTWGVALTAASVALSAAHGFIYLAAAGLMAVLIARYALTSRRRRILWPSIALVVSFVTFAILYALGTGYIHVQTSKSAPQAIIEAILRERSSPETFWGWLFAVYGKTAIDDVAQGAWVLLVVVWLFLSWRRKRLRATPAIDISLLVAVTWIAYLILPTYIDAPLHWWAADLRLPPIIALLPLGLLRPLPRKGSILRGAALAICCAVLLYSFVDLRRWHTEEMEGFEEVVDAVPPGRVMSTIFPRYDGRYPGEPEFYYGNYYLLRVGGITAGTFTDRRDWPYQRRESVPLHGWGHLHSFKPREHVRGFDGFILRVPSEPILPGPFGAEAKHLSVVKSAGHWAYVTRK